RWEKISTQYYLRAGHLGLFQKKSYMVWMELLNALHVYLLLQRIYLSFCQEPMLSKILHKTPHKCQFYFYPLGAALVAISPLLIYLYIQKLRTYGCLPDYENDIHTQCLICN